MRFFAAVKFDPNEATVAIQRLYKFTAERIFELDALDLVNKKDQELIEITLSLRRLCLEIEKLLCLEEDYPEDIEQKIKNLTIGINDLFNRAAQITNRGQSL